jgi:hypothetical protein
VGCGVEGGLKVGDVEGGVKVGGVEGGVVEKWVGT